MIPWTLAELVPHAGDMLLIDEILACDERGIETRLVVRPGLFTCLLYTSPSPRDS